MFKLIILEYSESLGCFVGLDLDENGEFKFVYVDKWF